MARLRSRGQQQQPTPNLSPQDDKLEDQDAEFLEKFKDEKRKPDSELEAFCTQSY